MLSPKTFLLIAANLAILTYNIGVLIYALPIPSRRIKRWAPILMEDSIATAFLIMLFSAALYISDYLATYSGTTLAQVASWLEDQMHSFVLKYVAGKLATIPIRLIPLPGTNVIASLIFLPISLVFYGVITATASLLIPIYVLIKLKTVIMALGIALYALPFRIGKNIGASLIAFAIVGNLVFHYVPHWMELVQTSIEETYETQPSADAAKPVYNIWGMIYDRLGNHPVYAVLFLTDGDSNSTYTYLVQPDGAYYTVDNGGVQSGIYDATLEYMGAKFKPIEPRLVIPGNLKPTYEYADMPFRLDLHFYSVIFLPEQAALSTNCYFEKINITKISSKTYEVVMETRNALQGEIDLIFVSPATYSLTSVEINGSAYGPFYEHREKPWRGVPAQQLIIRLFNYGEYLKIKIKYISDKNLYKPEAGIQDSTSIINKLFNIDIDVLKILDYVAPIFMHGISYTVAAFSFLTIASSLIIGFARFLGARAPKIVFDV